MSTVSSVSSSTSSTSSSSSSSSSSSRTSLGINDFLQLLTKQLSSQDPLNPMDDTAFISQMASFTSLQETNTLVTDFSSFSAAQAKNNASAYLGMTVTVTDSTATSGSTTGTVDSVDLSSTTPQVVINGTSYPVSSITKVQTASSSSTSTSS